MTIDFKPPRNTRFGRRRRPVRTVLLAMLLAACGFTFLFYEHDPAPETQSEAEADLQPVGGPDTGAADTQDKSHVIEGSIRSGETISSLLSEYFSSQELHELATESRKVFPLAGICAGQPYKLCTQNGSFERFEYDINRDDQLIITRSEDGFDVTRIPIDYEVKPQLVRGTINSSLFAAVTASGENDDLAMRLADIFAWDVDFIRDIRQGDSFQVIVEKRFREGSAAGYGQILAAEFVNQGKSYRAFRFKDGDRSSAYYDANGNSLKKAFLKAPLAFSRISSGFTMRRFHPITKTWKAHPAIDYAAPTGTPIMTIGDGTIIKIGYTKYNGNHIKIRHNSGIETLYLHMNKFAKGMKNGKKLAQGDVIGYVGSTGLATGPHLCFRMYRSGTPVNPSTVKTTAAAPVSRNRLPQFKATVTNYLSQFEDREILQAQALTHEEHPVTQ